MTIEELKALEAGLHGNDFAEGDIQTALDALPALLAVAEAAKELRDAMIPQERRPLGLKTATYDLGRYKAAAFDLDNKLAALETKEPKR